MSATDLDALLLNIDWSQNDWRDMNWDNFRPFLPTLRDETVHALARIHGRTSPDELSPLHLEQLRRFKIQSSPVPGTPGSKPIFQYFVDDPSKVGDEREKFSNDYGPLPPAAEFQGEKVGPTYTASVIIEVAIAASLANGVTEDPHERVGRNLIPDPANRHKYDIEYLNDIRDEVVRVVNASGVVATQKRASETSASFEADVRRAIIGEYGVDPGDLQASPSRVNYPRAIQNEAEGYYRTSIDGGVELESASFTWDYLRRRCQQVEDQLKARGVFDARTIQRIGVRHEEMLQLAWFKAKRDEFHIYIPGMRPRWRAWSVSQWNRKVNDASQVPWYNVKRADYFPAPSGIDDVTPFPEEHYKWFYGKIYTPVVPIDRNHIATFRDRIEWVTNNLRNNFRIHKEMPSLELSTTVNIGHTQGFTLLELKKIVTLWVLLDPLFSRLHRKHRSERNNGGAHSVWSGGGRINEWSRLAMGCRFADNPRQAEYFPYLQVFPKLSQKLWDHLIDREMLYWVPADWFWRLPRADQLFIHAVWCFGDVTSLAEALNPRWPNAQLSMRLRVRGAGRRTDVAGAEDDEPQTIEFKGMQQSMDAKHITSWVAVLTAFCHMCCRPDNRDAYYALFNDQSLILEKLNVTADVVEKFKEGFQWGNEYWEPGGIPISWTDPFYPWAIADLPYL